MVGEVTVVSRSFLSGMLFLQEPIGGDLMAEAEAAADWRACGVLEGAAP